MMQTTEITETMAPHYVEQGKSATTLRQFITFTLGLEEFGLDIMMVREIRGWTPTTILPKAPSHVRGVINLRGVIVPIIDLRARFGMGSTKPTEMHVVVIVILSARIVGLLVDGVSDIISVQSDAIRAVPDTGLSSSEKFVDGLVALEDRLVTLVSLEEIIGGAAPRLTEATQ